MRVVLGEAHERRPRTTPGRGHRPAARTTASARGDLHVLRAWQPMADQRGFEGDDRRAVPQCVGHLGRDGQAVGGDHVVSVRRVIRPVRCGQASPLGRLSVSLGGVWGLAHRSLPADGCGCAWMCRPPDRSDRPAWLDRSVASPPLRVPTGRPGVTPDRRRQGHGDIGIDAHKRTHTLVAVDEPAGSWLRRPRATTRRASGAVRGRPGSAGAELGGGGLPASVAAAGGGPAGRRGADRAGAAEADGRRPRRGARPTASPIRSTRWRSRAPRCASRICRWRRLEAPSASCGCWSIIARTWSPSGPARSTGCAGISTSSTRLGPRARARSTATARSAALAARLDAVEGTVARIARDLVDRIRELTPAINGLEREIATPRRARPDPAGRRVRRAHRRQDRRRDRGIAPFPVRATPSPATTAPHRCRSGPATATGTGCRAPATVNSTPPSTGSRSPRCRLSGAGRPTSCAD